ncbi:MAG: FGGY-family carbohydrate kinase [Desulfotignum sp.]|nr:FGGY-family carbohydrate kinase [Desulfotignum sp.]
MTESYLMGVDVGTQSAKVVIFDLTGHVVCQADYPLKPMLIPGPQLAIHPDDDLWHALSLACRSAMDRFEHDLKKSPEQILAMGLCVIRCCLALVRENGDLAYPLISWMDKRMNTPYTWEKAFGDVRYVTTSSGYITHRLTGERKDTCANYIGYWPMDMDTWNWSTREDDFSQNNLTRDMVFDVIKPGEILGRVTDAAAALTGLPAGLPVVATAHDKAVEALGAGTLEPGVGMVSLGTYIGGMVHGRENRTDAQNFWPFPAAVPFQYLYECMGVRRGMWTVTWFCEQFGGDVREKAEKSGLTVAEWFNREAAGVPAGCEGLVTIHDWAPPKEAVYRKGVMFGFDGRHTRAHMYRSILEGIALTMKNHMDPMARELGRPFDRLVISGGGANGDLFMQIFADVFGVPVYRNRIRSSASVGCVINAGVAAGVFDSYDTAIKNMVHVGEVFIPDMACHRLYNDLNQNVYQTVNPHFDPVLEQLARLVDDPGR